MVIDALYKKIPFTIFGVYLNLKFYFFNKF